MALMPDDTTAPEPTPEEIENAEAIKGLADAAGIPPREMRDILEDPRTWPVDTTAPVPADGPVLCLCGNPDNCSCPPAPVIAEDGEEFTISGEPVSPETARLVIDATSGGGAAEYHVEFEDESVTAEGSYDWWRTEVAARDADLEQLRAELDAVLRHDKEAVQQLNAAEAELASLTESRTFWRKFAAKLEAERDERQDERDNYLDRLRKAEGAYSRLDAEKRDLEGVRDRLRAQREEAEAGRDALTTELGHAHSTLADTRQEVDDLTDENRQLRDERDLLRETLADADLGAQILALEETVAAADADRGRLEAQMASISRSVVEVYGEGYGGADVPAEVTRLLGHLAQHETNMGRVLGAKSEAIERVKAQRDALKAAIERVRALHSPRDRGAGPECMGCRTTATFTPYGVCRTLAALDAPESNADAPSPVTAATTEAQAYTSLLDELEDVDGTQEGSQ